MSEIWGGGETDRVKDQLGHKIQTGISITAELVTAWQQHAASRWQQLQYQAQQMDRAAADRLRAQHLADEPIMRQVWSARWWDRADENEIAEVWEVAASWAHGDDPAGGRAVGRMRSEISKRYGVDVDPVTTRGPQIVERLAVATAPTEAATTELRKRREAAQARGEDPVLVAKAELVRRELTESWWKSAQDDEVIAVLEQMEEWSDGQVKRDLQDWFRQVGRDVLGTEKFDVLVGRADEPPAVEPDAESPVPAVENEELIARQDEANAKDLEATGDEELREQVTAAARSSKGIPPTARLNAGSRRRGLGSKKPRRSRVLRRSADTEVTR
ncbi:hypothetical protein [Actinomadura rayongensis]|uniref:Uncharacterized protein n=1 Tax=Actinomadura rayongensis TaxID=1429076 RepID=A0A6I4WBK5_9ACTN|nr:hypothetical protein [Actinomadura rayongensis]MXQ65645.1 hypothetical protein [Actinomadura rayongensis]